MERIHLVLDRAEKERYRRVAARAGKSLSQWLRDAAAAKLAEEEPRVALESAAALADFFAACDAREHGKEPDWERHRAVMERSRGTGAAPS